MKICYVDESGHCGERLDPAQPVEVVCGVITDASKVFKTQKQHSNVLEVLKDMGIHVSELKSAEIYGGRKEWKNADSELRDGIFTALLHWAKERKCRFIPCPIDSKVFFQRKEDACYHSCLFGYPYEAASMNVILAIQRENAGVKNNKGKTIVVFDEQKGHDSRLLKIIEGDLSFTDGYTGFLAPLRAAPPPRLNQIVDVPHFSKSHLAVLIQLADISAFVVSRYINMKYYEAGERFYGEFAKIETWYREISMNMIKYTSIDPPAKDSLCSYYKEVRPLGWSAKLMSSMLT